MVEYRKNKIIIIIILWVQENTNYLLEQIHAQNDKVVARKHKKNKL